MFRVLLFLLGCVLPLWSQTASSPAALVPTESAPSPSPMLVPTPAATSTPSVTTAPATTSSKPSPKSAKSKPAKEKDAASPAKPKPREFRGVWVVTAYNLNWPSRAGLSVAAQQAELIRLLDLVKHLGLRAVFFQVRPECDALYRSATEPWSRCLTGQQGCDPGYDPLQFACEAAAARGLELHAWINPFRAAVNENSPRAATPISSSLKRYAYWIEGTLYLDPGVLAVQEQIVRVVREIVHNYPVAGVHLDDYFYPYPKVFGKPLEFPDASVYAAYKSTGGDLSKEDWRRENINRLVQRLALTVHQERPGAKFSVSPFGAYRPGFPKSVKVPLDQYSQLYSDPVKWLQHGWVDFLVPQLYWPEKGDQSFSKLLAWWRSPQTNPRGVPVYPGIAVDRLSPPKNWPAKEIAQQLKTTRQLNAGLSNGYVLYSAASLQHDVKGVRKILRTANGLQ